LVRDGIASGRLIGKRLGDKPPAHYPVGEFGIMVERKIHLAVFSDIGFQF